MYLCRTLDSDAGSRYSTGMDITPQPVPRMMDREYPLSVVQYPEAGIIVIEGIKYSYPLFRGLGGFPIGTLLRVVARTDGVLTIRSYPAGEPVIA